MRYPPGVGEKAARRILKAGPGAWAQGANIDPERDAQRVLQRYMRRSKRELAQRLFDTEQAYANAESRWLRAQDRLLALELQLRQGTK